ncbi:ATP-dependent helicase [Shewanella xiamenensis]|uniref:ATP-dependent helicase n=1 Tax=Shewanella xiamenensis TaxID=332186 RepID=UPI0021C224A5|nr:ATP-dependent helicase [Shewanella xiamenensis]MCT8877553.1 ATP-dependent helicase [Shewanella xiamenensis]
MGLSDEQARAVKSSDQHNLIVALPGAGKTFTMISFIENLVQIPENKILALTFTKAAAEEMKSRIGKKVMGLQRKQVHISTFHSLILKQTQRHPYFSGRKLINGNTADRVTAHIAESYRVPLDISEEVNIVETVTHSKTGKEFREPKIKITAVPFRVVSKWLLSEYIATPHHEEVEVDYSYVFPRGIDDFYQYYLEQLAKLKYWPMDVMCVEITRALMMGDIEPISCTHLIVDEYQDTDKVQYEWIKCHGIAGTKLTVVGDDDQAIFSFRGSLGVDGMRLLQADFDVNYHTLSICFRCGNEILSAAGNLVSFNKERIEKNMLSGAKEDGDVYLHAFVEADEEMIHLCEGLLENIGRSRAVLARTNKELDVIESYLTSNDIECNRMNGSSIWESDNLRIYLHFMGTILQVNSAEHLTPILVLLNESQDNILEINSTLQGLGFGHCDVDTAKWLEMTKKLYHLCQESWHLASTTDTDKMRELVERVSNQFGGIMSKSVKDFSSLFSDILISMNGSSLANRVEAIEEMCRRRKKKTMSNDEVVLTSFHGSKGLEWDCVWLVGLDADNIPHRMPNVKINDVNVEEERRLLYVAMTRAKTRLNLSWAGSPCKFLTESFSEEDLMMNV